MHNNYKTLIDRLLKSQEASIRWKIRALVLQEADEQSARQLQQQIRNCVRVKQLLHHRDISGRLPFQRSAYDKWQGPHWVLATLADIGYPPGDETLLPTREDIYACWLDERYFKDFVASGKRDVYKGKGVPLIDGRYRRCASQQANALYFLTRLGLGDERSKQLVERLIHWQWPDGGWNCDKIASADTSSFMETILPLRGLSLYGRVFKCPQSTAAAARASEVFLTRRLYRRLSNGETIAPDFCKLHYPLYWHYDILHGLKVIAEAGFINDSRCADALDLLERKQLPEGGWPAEARYYKAPSSETFVHSADYVDWGGTSSKAMNEWVTADALYVLRSAGRFSV